MPDEDLKDQDTGVTNPDAGDQTPDADQGNNEPITKEAFLARVGELEETINQLKDQNLLYKTRLEMGAQQVPPQKAPPDPFEGAEPDDPVTVAQFQTALNQLAAIVRGKLGEVEAVAENPDYKEVVSKHLPNYLSDNPEMIPVLKALPDDLRAKLGYKLAADHKGKTGKKPGADIQADLKRIEANKRKPQVGDKGSASPLAKAQLYETMNDDELEKVLSRVKSGQAA